MHYSCSFYNERVFDDGNKEITIKSGLGKFSFECPTAWEMGPIDKGNDHTMFTIYDPSFSFGFNFLIEKIGLELPSANKALDDEIADFSKRLDYTLVNLSDINISGIQAKQAIFTYKDYQAPTWHGGTGGSPVQMITVTIFFEYNSSIWNILITNRAELREQSDVFTEHLIRNFKFLD